jgi:hypothetical protein
MVMAGGNQAAQRREHHREFRNGSQAEVKTLHFDARFTPESRHGWRCGSTRHFALSIRTPRLLHCFLSVAAFAASSSISMPISRHILIRAAR